MLKHLILRLYLYFKGVRFFRTEMIPKSPEFKKAVFEHVTPGKTTEFFFFKEELEDLVFKNGRIRKTSFIGYVLQARIDEDLPPVLAQHNNMKFFFNVNFPFRIDDETICRVLLDIYLDFLRSEMLENH